MLGILPISNHFPVKKVRKKYWDQSQFSKKQLSNFVCIQLFSVPTINLIHIILTSIIKLKLELSYLARVPTS